MLILLWGIGSEGVLKAVRGELDRLGAIPILIDQRDILDTEIELDISGSVRGLVRTRDEVVSLPEVTACYVRSYDWRELPAIAAAGPDSSAWRHSAEVEDLLSCWSEITPALVVNCPAAMAGNCSKPYQLAQIHEFGFRVPETIVTTDPDVARAFWQCHGSVIYKSTSGVRSRVSRLGSAHLERLADVTWCPTQFQQYVAGADCRVHVVGNDVFACEVRSAADDYRYPGSHSVELKACQLPREVEDRCRRLTSAMQLHVAGIDLRRTPDGEWFCFEVNPSPAFLYYETATGLPIAAAIAQLLVDSAGNRSRRGPQ